MFISYGAQGHLPREEIRAKLYPACLSRSELARISQILYYRACSARRRRSLFPLALCCTFYRSRSRRRLSPLRKEKRRFDTLALRIYHVGYLAQV